MAIRVKWLLLATTSVVVLGVIVALTVTADEKQVTTRPEPTTRLYVRTMPPGAKIVLDGEELGTSNGLFLVPPGVKEITLKMDGYDPKRETVEVHDGRITRVELELAKLSEPGDEPSPVGTVDTFAPVVVATVPQSGDTQVDPSITEIRVTFSKAMAAKSWSWTQLSDESFPATTGKPRYLDDKRTCVLPVELQPGKAYAIWLNSGEYANFKDVGDRAAVPYLLIFETVK